MRHCKLPLHVLLNVSLGTRDIMKQRTVSSNETVLRITYGLRSPHFHNLLCIRLYLYVFGDIFLNHQIDAINSYLNCEKELDQIHFGKLVNHHPFSLIPIRPASLGCYFLLISSFFRGKVGFELKDGIHVIFAI